MLLLLYIVIVFLITNSLFINTLWKDLSWFLCLYLQYMRQKEWRGVGKSHSKWPTQRTVPRTMQSSGPKLFWLVVIIIFKFGLGLKY